MIPTKRLLRGFRILIVILLTIFSIIASAPATKAQDLVIYNDSLQNGWQNWSWATTNFSNTSPVHTGADSLAVTSGAWAAMWLHAPSAMSTSPYASLSFWINGGSTGGQLLNVQASLNGTMQTIYSLNPLTTGWQQIVIPLSTLGVANASNMDGFWIQDRSGTTQATYYVDDVSLIYTNVGNQQTTVSIDAAANVHPISPYIYGLNWASAAEINDLNIASNRGGGNINSTYNWQNNAGNHAADWYFESLGGSSMVPGADEDNFISGSKAAGAEPLVTIPTLGWVAKLGPNGERYASFSVAKYGAQQSTDPWWPDAGNGVLANGTAITNNDPNDAYVRSDVNYIKPDLTRLVNKFGQAANGGVKFYILDNEVDAWHATHRDAHPIGASIDEMLNYTKAYGSAVKAADPTAKVIGWEVWNWTGCITSGYDSQNGGTDRAAHGNMDVYPYLLQQLKAYEQSTGIRPIDYVSIHFYPQGNDASGDNSTTNQLLRNRATRQLWDRNYTSESWMNTKIYAIPHLQDWINTYYPGLKTAITEYSWGGDNTMNGATTMADEIGIFGKYGLDLATRWGTPASPSYEAFKMYRNYDGNKSTFGDTSVGTTVPNEDNLSTFAAIRSSDGALTIMVVNKTLSGTTPVTLNIANFIAGSTAQVWQLSASTLSRQADVSVTSGSISLTVPAPSVTLFIVPAGQVAPPAPTGLSATAGNAQVSLSWTASSGATSYNVYRSTTSGGEGTTAIATGITSTTYTNTGLTNGTTYYYKVAAVNGSGTSTQSNEASATPVVPIPAAPSGLAATAGNAQVSLSWTASSGATSYNVYRGTTAGGESTTAIATGITSTAYTDTGLTNGTTYYYKVAAVNSAGTSAQSNEASATPVIPVPAAPTGLNATAGNAQVTLSWTASTYAASYNVYRSTTSGGEGTTAIATGITSTTYTNTSLTNGTTYYYKVAAVNTSGTSAQSNEAGATPTAGTNLVADGTYTIVGVQSGKALDDPGWSTSSGTQMDIWTINSGNNQKWILTNLGNNVVKLVNAFSGLALEVKNGSTSNGAVVDQATYSNYNYQQWTIVKVSTGVYNLKNVKSGQLLDVVGKKTADGTLVDQYTSNNGTNQQWKFQ